MNTAGAQPSLQFGLPPLDAFWVSRDQPQKIARAFHESQDTSRTLLRPISISPDLYKSSLDLQVPLTFMVGYVTTVLLLNRLNASRQNKPWAFSKTHAFKKLVVLHNASLALFSAWMFYGTCYSIYTSWPAGAAKEGTDYYAHVAQMFCETDSSAIRGKTTINPDCFQVRTVSDHISISPVKCQKPLGRGMRLFRLVLLHVKVL